MTKARNVRLLSGLRAAVAKAANCVKIESDSAHTIVATSVSPRTSPHHKRSRQTPMVGDRQHRVLCVGVSGLKEHFKFRLLSQCRDTSGVQNSIRCILGVWFFAHGRLPPRFVICAMFTIGCKEVQQIWTIRCHLLVKSAESSIGKDHGAKFLKNGYRPSCHAQSPVFVPRPRRRPTRIHHRAPFLYPARDGGDPTQKM